MVDLFEHVRDSGFPFPGHLVHLFVGGSELHGAKVHGSDDLDIYGVYIEPPEMVLGLESLAHFVWSTAGDGRRNGPNDVDVTFPSLKKWAGLASKGSPTALHFRFAEGVAQNPIWAEIVKNKRVFLSRACAKQFLGFADDPLKRMSGNKGRGKKGQRPESRREIWLRCEGRCTPCACSLNARNSCRKGRFRFLVLNATSSSAYGPENTRWIKSLPWRTSSFQNARKRRNRHLCQRKLSGPPCRVSCQIPTSRHGAPVRHPASQGLLVCH